MTSFPTSIPIPMFARNSASVINPTLLLVCGGFHQPSSMAAVAAILEDKGYPVETTALASLNNASVGMAEDVAQLQQQLQQLICTQQRRIVLLLHSFAGQAGSAAVRGLAAAERAAKGLGGGVLGIVYLAALPPLPPSPPDTVSGRQWQEWQAVDEAAGLVHVKPEHAVNTFYHDVAPDEAARLAAALLPHSLQAVLASCPDPAAATAKVFDGRRAYIFCTDDHTLPVAVQRALVAQTGAEFVERELPTSHSPFASAPAQLAALVAELAEGAVRRETRSLCNFVAA